jgi:hypothetical protein
MLMISTVADAMLTLPGIQKLLYVHSSTHVQALCSTKMRDCHWQELAGIMGIPSLDPQLMSLQQLLALDLASHTAHLTRISELANAEHTTLQHLDAIAQDLKSRELRATWSSSGERDLVIANTLQLQDLLVEDLGKLDDVQAGPFADRFKEEVLTIREELQGVKRLLDCWADCTRLQGELMTSFQDAQLRSQLAQQYTRSQRVLMRLQSILGELVPGVAAQIVIHESDVYEVCFSRHALGCITCFPVLITHECAPRLWQNRPCTRLHLHSLHSQHLQEHQSHMVQEILESRGLLQEINTDVQGHLAALRQRAIEDSTASQERVGCEAPE